MSKVAILGDAHMGARAGSSHFSEYFNSFFEGTFYPYLIENGIREIIQLGDLFDDRKHLSLKAFYTCKPVWFDNLAKHGIRMHVLLGNHDITMRESLRINTPESLLTEYIKSGTVVVYNKPTQLDLYGTKFDIIPWICEENKSEVAKFMKRGVIGDICVGHFEIAGFKMYRNVEGHGGLDRSAFERYERTFSGHYHTRSESEYPNIRYTGTPYEITWMDCNDPRGFDIFDTGTRQVEFVRNENCMFHKIIYRGEETKAPTGLSGKFVKVVAEKKDGLYKFDQFIQSIREQNPYDLSIVENLSEVYSDIDEDVAIEDTLSIVDSYIQNSDIDDKIKDRVKQYIGGLYTEALNDRV